MEKMARAIAKSVQQAASSLTQAKRSVWIAKRACFKNTQDKRNAISAQ